MGKVKAIFATGSNGEFSKNGGMPWGKTPIQGDGRHFMEYTKNSVVVMGRKTFESLPKKLKGRDHVVLTNKVKTSEWVEDGVLLYRPVSLTELIQSMKITFPEKDIVFIGGCNLIEEALPLCDEFSWTEVLLSYKDCDTNLDTSEIYNFVLDGHFDNYSSQVFNNNRFGLGADCIVNVYRKTVKGMLEL